MRGHDSRVGEVFVQTRYAEVVFELVDYHVAEMNDAVRKITDALLRAVGSPTQFMIRMQTAHGGNRYRIIVHT